MRVCACVCACVCVRERGSLASNQLDVRTDE
jgi:hypothetical protein